MYRFSFKWTRERSFQGRWSGKKSTVTETRFPGERIPVSTYPQSRLSSFRVSRPSFEKKRMPKKQWLV